MLVVNHLQEEPALLSPVRMVALIRRFVPITVVGMRCNETRNKDKNDDDDDHLVQTRGTMVDRSGLFK